ncbi:5-oxoprolinase subunit PxpB [Limnobacter humi]|uniref:5-oxoprolinase subunit PxpB n=1 Tax=Limnobacter humi TaxID=1778671 RepID=A0ABT1WHG6_9BURK|nr:5-oxoprolinase subunit PxpB [Limnobacter humi]MCQ8895884.1 5-oxoprolinase subunit PxpB [Limnobacter humi]
METAIKPKQPEIYWLSDRALQLDLQGSATPSDLSSVRLLALWADLQSWSRSIDWPAHEWVLADQSITVVYQTPFDSVEHMTTLLRQVAERVAQVKSNPATPTRAERLHTIEVVYGPAHGADFERVCAALRCNARQLIALHTQAEYTVQFLGFLPGFAYLHGTPQALHLPRLESPRARVPAGSVAVAAGYTAIYPGECPGGWHLIGQAKLPLFNSAQQPPALLQPGDRVRFVEAPHV